MNDIQQFLASKQIDNPYKRYKQELTTAFEAKNATGFLDKLKTSFGKQKTPSLLTKHNAELGLLLIKSMTDSQNTRSYYGKSSIGYKTETYNKIQVLLGDKSWDNPDNYNLLVYFFGEENAVYVRYAWSRIPFQMYQEGYERRSFRSPNDPELYLRHQINFIADLIPQSFMHQWDYNTSGYKDAYYNLSLTEQIRYCNAEISNSQHFRLWSAAIDLDNQAVLQQCEDIIFNKDEVGKVTRELIKSLLNSEKPAAWELVEKLLLAAQRQEGLRQTILESLDETSIGGLKFMIKVILDHQLTRFSSVVRSVDVWAGLGWESERETTVKNFLKKAQEYLENTSLIPEAVKSTNNMDAYMALWAQGVYDVELTFPYLNDLYKNGNVEKRCLALMFAYQTHNYKINMPLFYDALNDTELQVRAFAIIYIQSMLNYGRNAQFYDAQFPGFFDRLHHVYKQTTIKEKTFENVVFSWQKLQFDRKQIMRCMMQLVLEKADRLTTVLSYFEDMDATLKRQLTQLILPKQAEYNFDAAKQNLPLTPFQRDYAFRILKDRSEYDIAYKALQHIGFSAGEMQVFPDLLKRKSADFRGKIIPLMLKQNDTLLQPILEQTVTQGYVEQRLAGLDILLQLKKSNRLVSQTEAIVTAYQQRKIISTKEQILLEQLVDNDGENHFNAANGFGLYDVSKSMSPIVPPAINPTNIYEQYFAKHKYGFSTSVENITKVLQSLKTLVDTHKNYEYEVSWYNNTANKVLLGNHFSPKKQGTKFENARENYNNYPLPEVWEKWFTESGLQPVDLFLISLSRADYSRNNTANFNAVVAQIPNYALMPTSENYQLTRTLYDILGALELIFPFGNANEFCLGGCTRLFASLTEKDLSFSEKQSNTYYYNGRTSGNGWQGSNILNTFLSRIHISDKNVDETFLRSYWNLYHWRQFTGLPENIAPSLPPLAVFCYAFEKGIIGEDELFRGLISPENINILSNVSKHKNNRNSFEYFNRFPFLQPMYEQLRERILDIELKRGDSATTVTQLAQNLKAIYGVNRFAEILAGLGKTTLQRGYSYGNSGSNKQELFSSLLKKCFPVETDNQQVFNDWMKKIKVTESRLVEAAMYAPQWQKLVSGYLGWKGLDDAIWWMHAHTKTSAYGEQNAEAESAIAKYSNVDVQDFKDGAVDKNWFLKAYKEIGKERWPIVYEAAKYISDGNGHRRARLYADVMTGDLKIKEVTDKVKDKRDQDYLRIFGLVPLDKKNKEKDILLRYEYLQQFKKEGKQFGAQKQTSEALAIRVAMENLARNAGYPDPIRLTWAMETKQVQNILSKETQVQYGDVLIGLVIDEEGLANVVAFKDEKQLKEIPAKYKKDAKVEELNGYKKTMKEQFSRSRKGLEDAMVRGDEFTFAELKNLFSHPIISKHLEKLVFITQNNTTGFYKDENLVNGLGEAIALTAKDSIRIAHCIDLFNTKTWSDYQHYAFDKALKQPFKQIFRELYTPTADELAEVSVSRRYAGHQVQPKQTVALLKTRGWKIDNEEGLQKVYHKEGFTAKMWALADWFSPADVESPTLETVEFHSLKTHKNIAFSEINPRIFSETMRDIDLVVSVAHVGGVDPEASYSSIEMRAILLEETLRLLKLKNVTIKGSHAIIKGSMGEYNVHLGSAVVHQMAAGYLSILPVHSQHRGRLFLPFVDDDPKSAEMISKVLLLAKDNEIQDPTILRQIRRE